MSESNSLFVCFDSLTRYPHLASSWLSQFSHEAEVLFPPLMAMQIIETLVSGNCLVIRARFTINVST